MEFRLDKHDLFRNAIPGAVSLLVILFFYLFNVGSPLSPILSNLNAIVAIMAVAITLPIGYLIQNIYQGWHVLYEQKLWERYESDLIKPFLEDKKSDILGIKESEKKHAWFIEMCLNIKSSEQIRERAYTLISRVHSLGGSIIAIASAMLITFLFLFPLYFRNDSIPVFLLKNSFIILIWFFVCFCLHKARTNALEGYRMLIEHFVKLRQKLITNILFDKKDPFCKE